MGCYEYLGQVEIHELKIEENCRLFNKIPYQNKAIHFATMANINHDFLEIVKDENINVFVNSLLHMKAVQKAGFSGNEIIFTSSALSKETMQEIYKAGAQLNLDSPNQLKQWQELFPHERIGIRFKAIKQSLILIVQVFLLKNKADLDLQLKN